MAMSTHSSQPPEESLPEVYDAILPVDQLVHGEHNPRRVQPTQHLIESVATDGLSHPLIVRPDPDRDIYHITDGWQRYQAATEAGFERLPVAIYESPVAALTATEPEALNRSWSTYEWAKYCQSLAEELGANSDSTYATAAAVADHTTRSITTIQRYLDVLSLPGEIHPLLEDGPSGTDQQWAALKNHNPDVRQYSGLQWRVAAKLARGRDVSTDRQIGIAARAVMFADMRPAAEFVDQALVESDTRLELIRKRIEFGADHSQYLKLPRAVQLTAAEKQAIMAYCRRTQQSLAEVIEESLLEIAHAEDPP